MDRDPIFVHRHDTDVDDPIIASGPSQRPRGRSVDRDERRGSAVDTDQADLSRLCHGDPLFRPVTGPLELVSLPASHGRDGHHSGVPPDAVSAIQSSGTDAERQEPADSETTRGRPSVRDRRGWQTS